MIRLASIALACGSLAFLTAVLVARWHVMNWRMRRVGIALGNVLAAVAYGSGVAIANSVPVGLQTLLLLAALASMLAALAWDFDVRSDDPNSL